MSNKTIQKPEEQNGRAQEIDLETARRQIAQAEQEHQKRYVTEYQRLCEAYGLQIWFQPTITNDGRINWIRTVKELS